jgi:hypothetical protein
MIAFGLAEIVTSFTHHFLGLSTARAARATWVGASVGVLYAVAGFLVLLERSRAFWAAVVFLALVIVGRAYLSASRLYPLDSFRQVLAMTMGTAVVIGFAIYLIALATRA